MLKIGSYIHSKSNRPYTLLQTDILHSETLEPHVLYRAEYGDRKTWIRPQHMWEQEVEIEEPTGSGENITRKVPRFRWAVERDFEAVKIEALSVVRDHLEVSPEMKAIYLVPHPSEIRLVEIEPETLTVEEFMPFRFAPGSGREFPVVLTLFNDGEHRLLQAGRIKIPENWAPFGEWQLYQNGYWISQELAAKGRAEAIQKKEAE